MNHKVINSEQDSVKQYLGKIWANRSLIITLAQRDLKVKYAQTILGLAWSILQPLTAVLVYTIFFSELLNVQTYYPFVLFVLSGILFWSLFNYIFSQGSQSLGQNRDIIKKLAFPKIILPISKTLIAFVEFGITFGVFILLFIYFEQEWRLSVLLAPFFVLPLVLFSLGMTFLLSALSLRKRDLFHIVPFLVNFGIWLTPVFYPVSIVPAKYANWLYLNPIASCIQLFRWSFFGDPVSHFTMIGLCLSFLIFIIGFFYFKKVEDSIIDIL